jgi:glucosyl-3-phosphoglycerate synthase
VIPISVDGMFAGLVAAKRAAGLTVTVAIPARDEAATIGGIVEAVGTLVAAGLVDELLVCDDGSSDGTAAVAAAAGARVVRPGSIDGEARTGKGEALWTLVCHATGDIVVFLDADLTSFQAPWVARLVAPLIEDPALSLVKGRFRRPIGDEPDGGGRVTELVAKPAVALLLPHLAGIAQPLGGELAARRAALDQVPFVAGWGVDMALVADLVQLVGIDAVAQVDLGVRRHRNKSLADLGPMATEVLRTVLDRAGVAPEGLPTVEGRPPPARMAHAAAPGGNDGADDDARVVGG